jgi:hypothetical protein
VPDGPAAATCLRSVALDGEAARSHPAADRLDLCVAARAVHDDPGHRPARRRPSLSRQLAEQLVADLLGVGVEVQQDAGDLRAYLLHRDIERVERTRGQPLLFAQQSQQDVLGADVVVLEGPRLILRQDDDQTCTLGEPLELGPILAPPLPRQRIRVIVGG